MNYLHLFCQLIGLFGTVIGCSTQSADIPAPTSLRCEYRENPLNIEVAQPRLSWFMQSDIRDQNQTAYHVLVSGSLENLNTDTGDIWDSGKVDSNESIQVTYKGKKLNSREHVFWKVRVWDKNRNASEWSAPACWEMGLLHPEDWKAQWIGYDCESAPMLRREFKIDKKIERARVYICGLGYYELTINGSKIGDQVLDPGQTDYEERVFYVVHDVTQNLSIGDNALGVILGDGWYNQTAVNEPKYGWGDVVYGKPRLIMQLIITYTDGTETMVVSGGSWKGSESPILSNNVYAGETYDARLEQPGWDTAGFDDSTWGDVHIADPPGGVLVSQKIPPIKRMETLKPVNITNPKSGVYVFDMGQNFAGWAKLKVEADRGTTIQLRFTEAIHEDGMIDPSSTGVGAIHVIQTEKYTCKGNGTEIWEPRFTYHGFRYVEMTGFTGTPTLDNLEGVAVYTAVEKAGRFETSDDMLNRIQRTVLWTQVSNMHSVPEDCPAREKCGWLGDAHVTTEMTIYNFDMPLFWTKYVRDIETNRRSRNGIVEDIAPGKRQEPGEHPDWGSAFIQIPWYMYLYYGDYSVIREHYQGMSEFLAHVSGLAKDYIVYDGYGDWCPPGSARPFETPVELTSTAYYYFDAKLLAKMAQLLGKYQDTEKYQQLAVNIKHAFNEHFYDPVQKTYGSQTADAFALYLELVPEGDEEAVAQSLVKNIIEKHNGHHSTGVTGSLHLYWALGQYGYGDIAHKLLHNTTYPSIGYLFSLGATTMWESWGKRGGSLNHPMQGGFAVWFYQGIGGINPDPENPGFKHIIFRPPVRGDLTNARVNYSSIYGDITSEWSLHDNTFHWDITVPANTSATVYVETESVEKVTESGQKASESESVKFLRLENGCAVFEIGSGKYSFESRVKI
ncbi:MAG: family 78 glycoside hydrolase catalytic domain [Candidatus Latescibacteria bacterium]|nr:family 78 glycoside hydrolase catalytic domain [Candidatus Latescibacterota bacterium]